MQSLGAFADQATPVLHRPRQGGALDQPLHRGARALLARRGSRRSSRLGAAADVGGPALTKSKPIITDVGQLAANAKPLTNNLASLLTSLKDTGGIERLMDYLFYQVAAINGFDSYGHYLRAGLILNACSQYAIASSPDCLATFGNAATARSARAASADRVPGYADTRRLAPRCASSTPTSTARRCSCPRRARRTTRGRRGQGAALRDAPAAPAAGRAAARAPRRRASPPPRQPPASGDPSPALLDYLLGGGG